MMYLPWIAAVVILGGCVGASNNLPRGLELQTRQVVLLSADSGGTPLCAGIEAEEGVVVTAAHCAPTGEEPIWLDRERLNVWPSGGFDTAFFPPAADVVVMTVGTAAWDVPELAEPTSNDFSVLAVGAEPIPVAVSTCPSELTSDVLCVSADIDRSAVLSGSPVVEGDYLIGVVSSVYMDVIVVSLLVEVWPLYSTSL